MQPIHTHYDNLQLTQSATDAEIRQAYRRLSKKYHPDLSDDPDAHRIMQIVNRAYEILSNPQSRAEHDRWIALQYLQQKQVYHAQPIAYYGDEDREPASKTQANQHQNYAYTYTTQPHQQQQRSYKRVLHGLLLISLVLFGLILWQGWGWLERSQLLPIITGKQPEPQVIVYEYPTETVSSDPQTAPTNEPYTRPKTAPNGKPFPEVSGYIDGYPVMEGMGNAKLVIENIRNSSDVFAQLYEKNTPQPIRTFFVVEREEMMLSHLDAGEYFVRYYQLDNGEYLNSESVTLVRNQSATIYLQRGKSPNE